MSFTYKRKINYYETDKMGIVHHSNYIRFIEESRSRWLEELNISMEKLEQLCYTIPTLEVNCKYKYHVTSGDTIIIEPSISNIVRAKSASDINVDSTIVERFARRIDIIGNEL